MSKLDKLSQEYLAGWAEGRSASLMFLNATFDLDRRKQLGCDFLSATLGC